MSQVEIFMIMYTLLLGLAMAGLLSGVGELLRGRSPPRWGVLVPLASVVLFVTLLGAFVDSYAYARAKSIDMSFRSIAMPALAGVFYYLAAILAVPREQDDWSDLDAYFMARKQVIFGCIAAASVTLIAGVEVPLSLAAGIPIFSNGFYWIGNALVIALQLAPVVARRRPVLIAAMIANLALLAIIYLPGQPISVTMRNIWLMAIGG